MAGRRGRGWKLNWQGDQVLQDAQTTLAEAWTQVGLAVEGAAKKELHKGHGVETGTLRRSIHCAAPGYNWSGDDVAAASDSPERGGNAVAPAKKGNVLSLQVGSGLSYAAAIEFGFTSAIEYAMMGIRNFEGYRYLRNGLDKVKPQIPEILSKFFQKKFRKRAK